MTDKIIIISHLVVMSRIYYYIILDTIFNSIENIYSQIVFYDYNRNLSTII